MEREFTYHRTNIADELSNRRSYLRYTNNNRVLNKSEISIYGNIVDVSAVLGSGAIAYQLALFACNFLGVNSIIPGLPLESIITWACALIAAFSVFWVSTLVSEHREIMAANLACHVALKLEHHAEGEFERGRRVGWYQASLDPRDKVLSDVDLDSYEPYMPAFSDDGLIVLK